jgi:HPt (histidine-containing phosphotransfer) domain-containing protein
VISPSDVPFATARGAPRRGPAVAAGAGRYSETGDNARGGGARRPLRCKSELLETSMSHRWTLHPRRLAAPVEATGGAGGAAAVLDAQALARLSELDPGGKAGLLQRVLTAYTQSLSRLLEQVGSARGSLDPQALRHVAHTLKSSSASVGALTLAALCASVEARVRDGHLDGLEHELDALVAEAQRVLAGLTATPPSS